MTMDNILYELFVYSEWRPDPDYLRTESSSSQSISKIFSFCKPELTLVDYLSNFINQLQSWQICLGEDGKVVAILQDTVLEIRTKRGNFANVVARIGVPRDLNPQWRKMSWSPDCSLLAIAHSNGKVSLYDLLATNLFNIPPDCSQPLELQCTDTTHAVAAIIFLETKDDHKWSNELILVDYKGRLRSFFVSSTDGFKLNHKFSFEGGVSSVAYHKNHNMLFVTGLPSHDEESSPSTVYGLRGWRFLNEAPHYKLAVNYDKQQLPSLASWLLKYLFHWKKTKHSVIIKTVISNNGSLLACLHADGSISFWQLPIIKLLKFCQLIDQPGHDIANPLPNYNKQKIWPTPDIPISDFYPVDIKWWDDKTIIISRINGSVSICNIDQLSNLIDDKPVFLQGHPQLSSTFENGFLSLECEASLMSANRLRRKSEVDGDIANEINEINGVEVQNENDDEAVSLVSWPSETIRTILYIITDMERFQPKPKKRHLLTKIYRLLCLKSTTPDDLYLRKIENAEYEEALSLADKFNLDSDLVFQQQWRTSEVSSQSIKDYLNKVSKKIWVIQQCCDRVPEKLSAAKELLEFGLKLTNKEIYKGLNSNVDRKTFMEKNLWDNITPEKLSAHSSEILRYRYAMLFYLDRLDIYKSILKNESCTYSAEEYNRLRGNTICRSAIEFAKEGRVHALSCLWPHLCDITLQLLVLQNLPETLDPLSYKSLLPSDKSIDVYNTNKKRREKDWCEKDIFRSIWSCVEIDELEIDDSIDGIELILPSSNLTEWYISRAHQIEDMCGLSSNSLMLIEFAIEKHVPGLEVLHSLLITLDILMYDINVDSMSLKQLECESQYQVANLLMSRTNEDTVIDDLKNILFPYLERCEKLTSVSDLKESLLKQYILNLSTNQLKLVLKIFQGLADLNINISQCLSIAEDCFSAQNNNDNLSLCFDILESLPESSDDSVTPSNLTKTLDEMERYLNACQLLENHNIHLTYSELKNIIGNKNEMELLLMKTSRNSMCDKKSGAEWNELLKDLLQLHSLIFAYSDFELCHEIFASSMISSSNKSSIISAEQLLTTSKLAISPTEGRSLINNKNKFPYKINVSYKVPFEKSVVLVLKSARDYFDSASDLNDPSLEFSWACLHLIKDDNSEIQFEKNLILAMKIINEFELSLLPVQVRSYTSKIDLIKECLDCDERAYKFVDKILQLAKLLAISDDDRKREIIIVSLCAIKSVENEDYSEAQKLGKRLILISEGPSAIYATDAAQKLGTDSLLEDLSLRHQLLDLALLYCESQNIEMLLNIRSFVESEILQSEINNIVNITSNPNFKHVNFQDSMESTEDDYLDALTSPIVENRVMSTVIEKYIQKPLTALGDKKTWKNALNLGWMNDNSKSISNDVQIKNDGKLACHMFYANLHKDCFVSRSTTHYSKFSTPDVIDPQLVMLYSLIRNNLLQDSIKYGSLELVNMEVLVQCAEHTLQEDTAYCLSLLLSICNSADFFKFIQNIQLDVRNVHTILYFYCLMIYINRNDLPDDAFFQSPIKLVTDTIKFAHNSPVDEQNDAVKGLLHCENVLHQLVEGENLLAHGCPINIELFLKDDIYRKNAIMDLSKTDNKQMFELSLKLCKKYNLPESDIIINYVSHVILHCDELSYNYCNEIINDVNLLGIICGDNNEGIAERFEEKLWNNIDGANHNMLSLYFILLNNVDSRHMITGMNSSMHLKLLKKCKYTCSAMNYKYIISGPPSDEFFEYAKGILNKDNVGIVAKFLKNLPPSINFSFNSSKFYTSWLLNSFFNIPKNQQTSKKWMQQHREFLSYFNKLNQDDILTYTKEILFGNSSLDKLPPSTRIQIAFSTADYCLHEHNNHENINAKNKQTDSYVSWENVGIKITRWGKFLENFHSDELKSIIMSHKLTPLNIWRDIECSRGLWSEMVIPLTDLLLDDNFPPKDLFLLMNSIDGDMNVNDLILYTIENRSLSSSLLTSIVNCLVAMKDLKIDISLDVLDKMKNHTRSTLLSSKLRLELLSFYKTQSEHTDADLLDIIHDIWGQEAVDNLKEFSISEESGRSNALRYLLEKDTNWEKLKALVDLVNMWPLSSADDENKEMLPHVQLILKLIDNSDNIDENLPLLKLLMSKQNIPSEDILWIISRKNTDCVIGKMWLCLFSSDKNIQQTTLPTITSEIKDMDKYDDSLNDNLLSEILNKKLFPYFVKTKLYARLVNYLFKINMVKSSMDSEVYTIEMAIEDLLSKQFKAEAGALKMSAGGIPNTLKGFTESLLFKGF